MQREIPGSLPPDRQSDPQKCMVSAPAANVRAIHTENIQHAGKLGDTSQAGVTLMSSGCWVGLSKQRWRHPLLPAHQVPLLGPALAIPSLLGCSHSPCWICVAVAVTEEQSKQTAKMW